MKDFVGNELVIGNIVVYSGSQNRELHTSKIHGFTKKQVKLTYITKYGHELDISVPPQHLIKIREQ